jgi:UDP-N-acetylglucosamine--N-acetylmuramyl-(pentapeptide) pyrophosphoryl-undecaprenol N-acetylglucosamine transferase
MRKLYILAAGGSGGHLFPALGLAKVLRSRGGAVVLFTDERAYKWVDKTNFHGVFVSRFRKKEGKGAFLWRLMCCGLKSLWFLIKHRPSCVVGFGGYVSAPTMLAAQWLRIPTVVHECNVLLGKANKILLPQAKVLTAGVPEILNLTTNKLFFTGNPVRAAIEPLFQTPYTPSLDADPFYLLVLGGSQGAEIFSQIVPFALEKLPDYLLERIRITQQVRETDLDMVQRFYKRAGITAEIRPFFANVEDYLQQAHLVISRSGALSLADISVSGRPSILVPFSHSSTGDQRANALRYSDSGASIVIDEAHFSAEFLKNVLVKLMENPESLLRMSGAARDLALPDAANRLADIVESFDKKKAAKQALKVWRRSFFFHYFFLTLLKK